MNTDLAGLVAVVILTLCSVFIDLIDIPPEGLLLNIRRKLVILVWGHGGDILEWLSAILCAIGSGMLSLFDVEYARRELNRW